MASTFDTNDYGYVRTDNIFGGQAPNYNWGSFGGGTDWNQTPGIDFGGQFNLPGLSGTGALSPRSSDTDWLTKGAEALSKALSYKGQLGSSSGSSRNYRGYGSNIPTAVQGRGYTMYMPNPTQKSTQTGGSSGIGRTLGTIAGIGVSMIPGVGQAAAAAAPAIGGTLGGFFG